MAEKCLLAATIAILACHPSITIKCIKPKSFVKESSKKPKPTSPSKALNQYPNKKSLKTIEKLDPNCLYFSSSRLVNTVSEVLEGNPLFGYIETLIKSSWLDKTSLKINKILRVSHSVRTLLVFEQYRQMVCRLDKRLGVEGNELMRFHATMISCSLGSNGSSSSYICGKKRCGVCRVLGSTFSIKDGSVSFIEKSGKAHEKVMTSECRLTNNNGVLARKAIIVCRVIAGRVAYLDKHGLMMNDEEGGFDSVLGLSEDEESNGIEELFVLNRRAVLPCFVVTYSV